MTIDTTQTIEINGSMAKLLGLVALGVIMTGGAAAVAFLDLSDMRRGDFVKFIAYFGVPFFGLCTLIGIKRLFSAGTPVVTISPAGIVDTRVAKTLIPRQAVERISTWAHAGQKVMVLAVTPAAEEKLQLTTIAKWSRAANAKLGADGLCVTAQGLQISYDTLYATSVAYAEAAHRKS
jgi:hypothetical protein